MSAKSTATRSVVDPVRLERYEPLGPASLLRVDASDGRFRHRTEPESAAAWSNPALAAPGRHRPAQAVGQERARVRRARRRRRARPSPTHLVETLVAFVAFCLAASGTYFLNDALDVEADRLHPTKRYRPDRRRASSACGLAKVIAGGPHRRRRSRIAAPSTTASSPRWSPATSSLTVSYTHVAEARAGRRPRRGRRRASCSAPSPAASPPTCRSPTGSSSSPASGRCSWSPASATPSRSSSATTRRGTARTLERVLARLPRLRARGRVGRRDRRLLPVGVRERGRRPATSPGSSCRSCRSCSRCCATRSSSSRAGRRARGRRARRPRAAGPRRCCGSSSSRSACMPERGRAPCDASCSPGWGRTAPTAADGRRRRATPTTSTTLLAHAGRAASIARGLGRSYGDAAQNAGGAVARRDRARPASTTIDLERGVVTRRRGRQPRRAACGCSCRSAGSCRSRRARASSPSAARSPPTSTARTTTSTARFANHVAVVRRCTRRRATSDGHARPRPRAVLGHRRRHGPHRRRPRGDAAAAPGRDVADPRRHRARARPRRRDGAHGRAATTAYRYSVAWIDCLARGAPLGRGGAHPRRPRPARRAAAAQAGAALAVHAASTLAAAPPWVPERAAQPAHRPRVQRGLVPQGARAPASATSSRSRAFFHPLDGVRGLEPHLRQPRLRPVPVRRALRRRRRRCARSLERAERRRMRVVPRRAEALRARQPRPALVPDAGLDARARHPGRRRRPRPACSTSSTSRGRGRRPRLPGQGRPRSPELPAA